ncbi:N-acetyltransferase [Neiella marina]|uniref:N-acetyltransferase n=1 Tax=Neiella holothuriorum TaxID=2870530 RepID=A0ABS7EDJ4_9GAMM|nr:N-acetyltransferase [Neiella holothuriorum]MBW8189998.1 N-acetyltransferase [Neiella holothuriorum]
MQQGIFQQQHAADVEQLFEQVFSDAEGAEEGRTIAELVHNLITTTPENDLQGFVTQSNRQLIASIFFTPLTFEASSQPVLLLSPVAVHTQFQGQGIGQRLIHFALAKLKQQGVDLVVTYGDPYFYSKVGFAAIAESMIKPPFVLSQPEGWLGQSLTNTKMAAIRGKSSGVSAFSQKAYW